MNRLIEGFYCLWIKQARLAWTKDILRKHCPTIVFCLHSIAIVIHHLNLQSSMLAINLLIRCGSSLLSIICSVFSRTLVGLRGFVRECKL
jgi:hypothetical protein